MENKPEVDEQLVQLVSNLTQGNIQRMNQTAEELRKELGLPPEAKYELLHMLFGSESSTKLQPVGSGSTSYPSTEQSQPEKSTEPPLLSAREGVSHMESHQPQMFGTYRVISPLGKGGFAQVYLVEDNLGRQWALKKIHQDLIKQDPSFRERFEREAHIQAGLKHEHIAGVHTFDAEEGYLVIDYIDGKTLQNLLDDDYPDGMDLRTVVEILEPIEDALTYIHKNAGFAHLDITPKNILIQERQTHRGRTERHVVLADFGLARVIDSDGRADFSMFAGAPGYWAPEQRGPTADRPGTRSDIYSLGLVIGVMLTGRRAQEVLAILRGTNNTLPSTLPWEVMQVLQRATADNPSERYATVKGLVTAFMIPALVGSSQSHSRMEVEQTRSPGSTNGSLRGTLGLARATLLQKIVPIIAVVVLLSFVAGLLIWNLPQTHWTQLQGLDLTAYCHSLHYQEVIGDSACSSPVDMTAACNWQWSRIGLHIHFDNPNDPNSGSCYDSHGNQVGGINDMDGYCKHQGYYGMPTASPDKTGGGWACQQKLDVTLACTWEFSRTDVQARRDDAGNWDCYSLF